MKKKTLGKLVVSCALLASVVFLGQEKPAIAAECQICNFHENCTDYCLQLGAVRGFCNARAHCCFCVY